MKILLPVLAFVLCAGHDLIAQRLQARLVTSAYAWQRQDTVGSPSNHLYGYQTVQLGVVYSDFSVHSYFQAFNDFLGPIKNDPQVRLYTLYVQWRNIAEIGELNAGRQFVAAGVGIGTIDGLKGSVKLLDSRVKVIGYLGTLAPAGLKTQTIDKVDDNAMFGGQVVASPIEDAQVSLSYMRRQTQPEAYKAIRRDSLFNPFITEIRPSASVEEFLSGDANISYQKLATAYFRYDHDLQAEQMSRVQVFARVTPLEWLGITAEYLKREPRVSFNSIFSVFTYNSLQEYDLGLEYKVHYVSDLQAFGKYGEVSFGDEISKQYTFGLNWKYVSASASRITGYNGRINAASVNAGYPLMDRLLTPTVMFTYGRYKLSRYQPKREVALSGAVGLVYRPLPLFSVDTQIQWIQNKIYKNDVRLFLRASYFLNEHLNVF